MNWSSFKAGLRSLVGKQRVDREMNEELESYIEASAAHKQNLGMSPADARRAALVEMGSRSSVKHQIWSSRWESALDNILQDIRFSLRDLAKSPGFTVVALLSLALGIGANTAIFTLIHQVLLQSLPVPHPEQLVTFGPSMATGDLGGIDMGDMDMFTWEFARRMQANPGPFQGIAASSSFSPKVNLRLDDAEPNSKTPSQTPATQAPASLVSGNFFSVLGAAPLLGRALLPSDADAPGRSPVVVLGYRYWLQELSADPSVLGKTLSINGSPFRIVGVMPSAFHGIRQDLQPPGVWVPVTMQHQIFTGSDLLEPGSYFLHLFGRLAPGTNAARPSSRLTHAQFWLDQQVRAAIRASEGAVITAERQQAIERQTVVLTPGARGISALGQQYGSSLSILMVVTALVLMIACANLANFLLARAAARQREIATRLALGSSRARIVRQSLIETSLLSLTGGLLGLAIAFAATRALIAFLASGAAFTSLDPAPNLAVLLFTLGISLLTGIVFGLAPAIGSAHTSAAVTLSSIARGNAPSRSARLFPRILVTAQAMLSLLLLTGAGLFLRTLQNLQSQDFGFERSHLVLAEIDPELVGYHPEQVAALHQTLIERMEALPGVQSAAISENPPISLYSWVTSFTIPGYHAKAHDSFNSTFNRVSGHYFETTGISLLGGHAIRPSDSATSLKVAVVNEAFTRHYFPNNDAIGSSFTVLQDTVAGPWQIVGVARDTRAGNPRNSEPGKMVYLPLSQMQGPDRFAHSLELRTTADPASTIADLRRAVARIDPNLPLSQVRTIHEHIDTLLSHEELIATLTGVFSLLALLLAAIGLYGIISYSVVRRTHEIGIRLALGAQSRAVRWLVLRESLILLLIGLALGLPLTLASTRFIHAQLFGVTALDPATFASAIAVVAFMTLLAAWLPARRATLVDPMIALRCD